MTDAPTPPPVDPPRPAGVPDPTGDPGPTAPGAVAAERRRRAERARQALVSPWSERSARRVRWIALALVVIGPLVGTASALLLVPASPGDLLPATKDPTARIDARGTIRSIDPVSGEATVRVVLTPAREDDEAFDATGIPRDDVVVLTSDATGQGYQVLPAGRPMGTVTVVLALADSRATRYPVDRYRTALLLVARVGEAGGETLPVRLDLRSGDPGFSVDVVDDVSADGAVVLQLEVARRSTVVGWALFFVLVCWMLAISAASIGWTTIVRGVTAPAWAWGFLIGVLFALPPLRNALPGSPPGGSLVDFAAFYWAVGIVSLTLVVMIGSWNVRVRRAPHAPDSPRP